MVLDRRRRARQLAKKAAAAKARARQRRRERSSSSGHELSLIRQAAGYPIYECKMGDILLDSGFGTVIVSRRLGATIASSVFLLDTYCLGVKSSFARIQPEREYRSMLERLRRTEELVDVDPAYARKLVEGAVKYALDLGFEPDEDYGTAKLLFGDIDADACRQEFTFGKDGKPLYVSGPNDSDARVEEIINTLERHSSHDGFD